MAVLVAETTERQVKLETRYPHVFESVDAAVEKRNTKRKDLNDNPDFQARNISVVAAGKAVKAYEEQASPNLTKLDAEAKAYSDALKTSGEK